MLEMVRKYWPTELGCESDEEKEAGEGVQSEPDADTEESQTDQMQQLIQMEGLDVKTGLLYCMDEEDFYLEILKDYMQADKVSTMKQFFAEEDWDNYRTVVHALKSTSLTIGAVHLSEEAKALEMAAKEEDTDYIRSHHKDVLDEYIRLTDRLKEV